MSIIRIVNMIPRSLSNNSGQDSEPNIAVNPENPLDIVATAFTPAPMGGAFAPIYISTDGGNTWSLRTVVPGNGFAGTSDITVAFATRGGTLYAGTLNGSSIELNILRTPSFTSTAPMQLLVERASEDQPWVVAGSIVVSGASRDRVFVGSNDFNQPGGKTATVDVSQDAAHTLPPAGFSPIRLEQGTPSPQDGPPIRTALHSDGTVYSAFQRWNPGSSLPNLNVDVVVVRDDNWGAGNPPFQALGGLGVSVAKGRFMVWNAIMGQERLGSDLAIAVDPTNSSDVWIAWCDRVGGSRGTDWTLHVSRSVDRGRTWSADVRTITNVKNPSLAINSDGLLGLLYQAFTGSQWVTTLELTANAWATPAATHVLHQAPSSTPARTFLPYLGDYVRLLALGKDFFGVFCANNTPDTANFPIGVTYQRNANWSTHQLLSNDGVTVVPPSIDPFFFHYSHLVRPPGPIIAPRPVLPSPVHPSPIRPRPIRPVAPGPLKEPTQESSAEPTDLQL